MPANNNYKVLANGAEKVGYKFYATGPYGTNAEPYDGRPARSRTASTSRATRTTSKWSTAVAEIPRALDTGKCDLRPSCQAVQITHDASGRVNAVLYLDADGNLHRQAAKVVCVAGNSIETPRLLLMSASSLHPDGLANSSGQVGRNYMRHTTGSVYASSTSRCTCTAARRWPASSPTRPASTPRAGSPAATTSRRSPSVRRSSPRSSSPGSWGRSSPSCSTPTRTPRVCGSWARTCRRRTTGSP